MSIGQQEKEKQTEKSEKKKQVSKAQIFDHIRESCFNDQFYLTKILVSAFGKHAGMMLLRLAIYILIVYPFFTEILGLTRAIAGICMILVVIAYYSLKGIYIKLRTEVQDGAG